MLGRSLLICRGKLISLADLEYLVTGKRRGRRGRGGRGGEGRGGGEGREGR